MTKAELQEMNESYLFPGDVDAMKKAMYTEGRQQYLTDV